MNETPKCDYCAIMGETPHCHNCKIFNKIKETPRPPRKIPYKLKELISYIENLDDEFNENLQIGDYFCFKLSTGESLKAVLIGKSHDVDGNNNSLGATFAVKCENLGAAMSRDGSTKNYENSEVVTELLPHIFKLLPKDLRDSIKSPKKLVHGAGNGILRFDSHPLWLLSECEFTTPYYTSGDGELYEYFNNEVNRTGWCRNHRSWLRSQYSSSNFCYMSRAHMSRTCYATNNTYYPITFCFCI